ncbi:MAG: hypothetical protein M3495_12695, partial [Pseudomonadota bacterium]|nr:hypothetical protein [Pseudomonadota bacterium]
MRGTGAILKAPSGASVAALALRFTSSPARTETPSYAELAPTRSCYGSSARLSGFEEAALGYAWVGCEQQVAAAVKLIPLGQPPASACS